MPCTEHNVGELPHTHNQLPNGSYDDGCRDDSQTAVDAQGFYTYVVGSESQRAQIESMPSVTFVPISSEHVQGNHRLVLRNLLSNNDFSQAVQNVPSDAESDQAAAVTGDYYPRTTLCALSALVTQGVSACRLAS